jgi:hypothetical protein
MEEKSPHLPWQEITGQNSALGYDNIFHDNIQGTKMGDQECRSVQESHGRVMTLTN